MYIMRLDDASEHWNKENWHRMHDLLAKNDVKPIVAIIPNNEDKRLTQFESDDSFIPTMLDWISEGWTPALHGYNHVMDASGGGINPVNQKSEFVGKPIEVQREKIRCGVAKLKQNGITPRLFVAPAHTFDDVTIQALKLESDIRIISDTVANDVYYKDGMYFIPRQSGRVRKLRFKTVTFCYHPNDLQESGFQALEEFIQANQDQFVSFDELQMDERKRSAYDWLLSTLYFAKRRLLVR